MKYLPFEEAREFVHNFGVRNQVEWNAYCKSGKKPDDIPSNPPRTYINEWLGWGDWLGTGKVATQNRIYRLFEQARGFVHSLQLQSRDEWRKYYKSRKKPDDIPAVPGAVYKKHWLGWGDWLGTGNIAPQKREFRDFIEARNFVRSLGFTNWEQWSRYCSSRNKPLDIPSNPNKFYKKHWLGWGDWLGTGRTRKFRSFDDARKIVRSLGLKSKSDWTRYSKGPMKLRDLPTDPRNVYKKHWLGWGDWLGTARMADKDKIYRPFKDARQFVHSLRLESKTEWERYCKSGKKPSDIPANAPQTYQNEWTWWADWLGFEGQWNLKKIKEFLRGLIKSRVIYQWNEAVLYSFLLRKGVLNLSSNRHANFFKNLIEASQTEEGRALIKDYANSDSEIPPNLSKLTTHVSMYPEQEVQTASAQEITQLANNEDPLDYKQIKSVQEILAQTSVLESINVDEEAIDFYLNYSIEELWKSAFENELETVKRVKQEGLNGNKYHDTVVNTFLYDYEGSKAIELPFGFSFPYPPTLMQLYVAYKIRTLPYFGNFSATGAGKTLSAIIASLTIDSRMTVIVCPNDVVEQWKRNIFESFLNSEVITGRDAFNIKYSKDKYKYLVLNYDKFSQDDSPNLILTLAKQRIDFVILDEVHFTKIRNEEEISQRRRNLDGLMTQVRRKNPSVKVLGLSATPVVNNLREGKSLLELLTGKVYDDVATRPTIPNAVTLYEKLSSISIRELPNYSVDLDTHVIDVVAQRPAAISLKHLKGNPLAIEKFLTDARIPEIIKLIDGQSIIYTEYVEDIIRKISEAVRNAGYSFALYTGTDRSGLSKFLNKNVQVLIASRPLSVGVDGLQHICNRLIINTLPWTNAQYQQLLGRLVRKGQIRDVVHVYLIKASIGGYQYDELKWKRIQFKRTLADCAVDGVLPEKNLVTPQQAAMEAVRWLERLERGEVSTVVRRDLNVELAPVEIKKRIVKYGDFVKLNNRINNEISETTHHRMLSDATEWEEYHRQYREARKSWTIVPYEEIIKRIKQLSPRLMIGDFGCGEAQILKEFGDDRVYNFDHVAINNKVKACDMKSVPLPDEAIDIAVFSLSLMGRNWPEYIAEAKRCLAAGGYLLIAETTKSLKGRLSGLREIIVKNGFDIYVDEERGDFTFIEARQL